MNEKWVYLVKKKVRYRLAVLETDAISTGCKWRRSTIILTFRRSCIINIRLDRADIVQLLIHHIMSVLKEIDDSFTLATFQQRLATVYYHTSQRIALIHSCTFQNLYFLDVIVFDTIQLDSCSIWQRRSNSLKRHLQVNLRRTGDALADT